MGVGVDMTPPANGDDDQKARRIELARVEAGAAWNDWIEPAARCSAGRAPMPETAGCGPCGEDGIDVSVEGALEGAVALLTAESLRVPVLAVHTGRRQRTTARRSALLGFRRPRSGFESPGCARCRACGCGRTGRCRSAPGRRR